MNSALHEFSVLLNELQSEIANLRGSGDGRILDIIKENFVRPVIEALGHHGRQQLQAAYDTGLSVGTGNTRRADFALMYNGLPVVLIEVCTLGEDFDEREVKLARFHEALSSVNISVLTNGDEYRVYATRLDDSTEMEREPILSFFMSEMTADQPEFAEFVSYLSRESIDEYMQRVNVQSLYALKLADGRIAKVIDHIVSEAPQLDNEFIQYICKKAGLPISDENKINKYREYTASAIKHALRHYVADELLGASSIVGDEVDDSMDSLPEINIDDPDCFELTFANIEDSTSIRVKKLYLNGEEHRISMPANHKQPTMQDVFMTMIEYLDESNPVVLPKLIERQWQPTKSKITYLTDTLPFGMEGRYKIFKGRYVYTNLANVQILTTLRLLLAEYDIDASAFKLVVKKYKKPSRVEGE